MADDDNSLEGIQIAFASGGMPDEVIDLRGVWGSEKLSRLFEYDLVLSRRGKPFTEDELDTLLSTPCAVALGPRPGDHVHGVLESIQLIDSARGVMPRYRARMVPTVWLLTLARTNRVFQHLSVPRLVEKVLAQYGLAVGADFEILVSGTSPEREYIVQYRESDWDFLQRWLEHEGFFYWFEHQGTHERLIISNTNADATPIEDPSSISYRERNNLSSGRLATVWDWTLRQRRVPARVAVFDYNYRKPSIDLCARQEVDGEHGFGSVFLYGEHFKDNDQGKVIAGVRADRLRSERRTFAGRTDCARFRVGHSFELENHHDAEHDQRYLITRIEHKVGMAGEGELPQRYLASFDAIPLDVAFRPERVTPWPRIDGVIHAHVESDSSGEYAQIDELGRYKVRMPFDGGDTKGTRASRWIRMAQPYSGSGYGTHFPLHKGTEVLLAHLDGDPDRPIIVGSVPNPHTASPSTSANATQSVIQTASGIRIEMEDLQS